MTLSHRLLPASAVALIALTAHAQSVQVIPNGLATSEGTTTNLFPWGRGSSLIHVQFLYDSSHFTSGGVNQPIVITRLRWRADGGAAAWNGGSYSNVQIDLSSAAVDYAAPSTTFANNHGTDRTTVHNGSVTVLPGQSTGLGTGPWFVDVPLATPFAYDPTQGNDLCVDVQFAAGSWNGGSTTYLDIMGGSTAMATRVYNSTAWPSTTGFVGQNHGAVMEVTYTPATGLWADFAADARSGAAPLAVQFRDLSHTDDPTGIVAWSWDLDGDGIIDSTAQNPSFVYPSCGAYNVSLTVFDASHAPSTITRPGFIVTDEVTPSFTWTTVTGTLLQFTDTSSPPPTSWAWDLDGDGVVDSTAQNPTWTYPRGCSVARNVSLTVHRACQGPFTTARNVYIGDSVDTTYAGGGGTIGTWGNLFDLQVTNPQGISICALSCIANAALGTPFRIDVYVTPNTYLGKETTPTAWRPAGTASGTVAGYTVPSVAQLATSLYLAPGNYGIALFPDTTGMNYTGQSLTFGNADLTMNFGSVRTDLFGNLGAFGFTYTGRTWNGTVHYTTVGASNEPGYGFFAAGCAGTLGVPGNTASSRPALNATMVATIDHLPLDVAICVLGFSRTNSPFGPLPLDLAPVGAPGCTLTTSIDARLVVLGNGGSASLQLALPNQATLLGARFYTQALALDPGANGLGGVTSDAAAAVVGG